MPTTIISVSMLDEAETTQRKKDSTRYPTPPPITALVIAGGQLDSHIYRFEFLIDADLSPHARVAGIGGRITFPSLSSVFIRQRNRMEDPKPLTGPDVESADVALYILLASWHSARAVSGADNDHIFRNDRSRVQSDFARDEIDLLIVIEFQIDHAVPAETRHRGSCLCSQSDEAVAWRHVQNSLLTPVCPVRQAASRQLPWGIAAAWSFALAVSPQKLAG